MAASTPKRTFFLALIGGIVVAATGCGDFKTASSGTPPADGGSSGTTSGGSNLPQDFPGASGPGDHGSLPSGYCCTEDADCRDRHCVVTASGSRMCLDSCRSQGKCIRREHTFTCDAGDIGDVGLCQPPLGFQCVPADRFLRGNRQVGECCQATGNGNAGEECEGNKCIAVNKEGQDNPFVCTHACTTTRDCPSGTVCGPLGNCDPANLPYTCK
ncbi:MAG: hypothetical protein JST00_36565 [Deltaproteobacteria bacterium]|nr:hypothetical protein [Deltaproteobacteria bacterium]